MLYLDLSQTNASIEEAVAYINGQINTAEDVSEPFNVVIEDNDGIFSEFRIDKNKKELVKSTFLSSPGLSPRSDSNIASNSESVKPDVLGQAAYHGSAYLFDKFRTDKVNSGEGSQYFGWGLYFTQSKQIAAEYAQRQGDLKFKDGGRVAGLPDLLSVMGKSESLKKFEDTVDRISGKPGRWKEVLDNFCVGIGVSDNDILQAIDYASFETRPEGNTFKEMMASRSSGLTDKENAVKAALEDFLNTGEGLRFYDLSHTWGQRPHYVYSVELPDGKYLDWNAPMPEEDRQLIRSRFLQESGESLPDEIEGDPELDRPDNKFETGRDFYRGLREMSYFRGEPRDISGFPHPGYGADREGRQGSPDPDGRRRGQADGHRPLLPELRGVQGQGVRRVRARPEAHPAHGHRPVRPDHLGLHEDARRRGPVRGPRDDDRELAADVMFGSHLKTGYPAKF